MQLITRGKAQSHLSMMRTIILLLHYFICYLFVYPILLSYITMQIDPQAKLIHPLLQLIVYIWTCGFSLFLAWPVFRHANKYFRENRSKQIGLIFILTFIIIAINLGLSLVVNGLLGFQQSENQQGIEQAVQQIPLITIIATCGFSVIIEECVFRAATFTTLRKNLHFFLSALVSSLLFGAIHVSNSLMTGNYLDVVNIVVYAGMGIILAYAYECSDSIYVPLGVHFFNNFISMSMLLFA